MQKTNKELGRELGVTSRQISKSRRRRWMWKDGVKVMYIAPHPLHSPGRSKVLVKKGKKKK